MIYDELEKIGEGAFGCVHKIRRKADGQILVWKEIFFGGMSEKEKQMLVAEVNLMREFVDHPNIVRYYDRVIDKVNKRIYIVMEYCSGGDLSTAIKHQKSQRCLFGESFLWSVLEQVTCALRVCHERQNGSILHRDLKPSNIMLDATRKIIKLGDFGLAKVLSESSRFARSYVGTPSYMSPEQVREEQYNVKSDIWSLGCLMYELTTLKAPFRAHNHLLLARKISDGEYEPIPRHFSLELRNIIDSMLSLRPSQRPDIDTIVKKCQKSHTSSAVSMLHEIELDEKQKLLETREKKLHIREQQLHEREAVLREQEDKISVAEQKWRLRASEAEALLQRREERVATRENALTKMCVCSEYMKSSIAREYSPLTMHNNINNTNVEMDFLTPKTSKRCVSRTLRRDDAVTRHLRDYSFNASPRSDEEMSPRSTISSSDNISRHTFSELRRGLDFTTFSSRDTSVIS